MTEAGATPENRTTGQPLAVTRCMPALGAATGTLTSVANKYTYRSESR
jgi:hypothetical protein